MANKNSRSQSKRPRTDAGALGSAITTGSMRTKGSKAPRSRAQRGKQGPPSRVASRS